MGELIIDFVSGTQATIALICAILVLYFLKRKRVLSSYIDPLVFPFFQTSFTFFILVQLALLPWMDIAGYIVFLVLSILLSRVKLPVRQVITVDDWLAFADVVLVIAIISNIYLIATKGFILFEDDLATAKVEFYEGYGLFRRVNEIAPPILAISALYTLKRNKFKSIVMIVFVLFIALTSGSKAGLITTAFLYGAYIRYNKGFKINALLLVSIVVGLWISSLFMFYLIYGNDFLSSFAYRFLSFADGPVYYFKDKMYIGNHVSFLYPFDQFLVSIRAYPALRYDSLGPWINYKYFSLDNALLGPNPQIFVEARALLGQFSVIHYAIVAVLIFLAVRICKTPFGYTLFAMPVTFSLPSDSQLAFNNVFTLLLLALVFVPFFILRRVFLKKVNHETLLPGIQ